MEIKSNTKQLLYVIFTAALIVFFYSKSFVDKKDYNNVINGLNKIKEVNNKLYGDVFLTKYNRIKHYDVIRNDINYIISLSNILNSKMLNIKEYNLNVKWNNYSKKLKVKEFNLNSFISHDAVFKNFMNHYPKLSEDMYINFKHENNFLAMTILKLQNQVLLLNKQDIFNNEFKITMFLNQISKISTKLKKSDQKLIGHYIVYTNKLLHFSKNLTMLEDKFLATGINKDVNTLITTYSKYFRNIESTSNRYLSAMMLLSLFLLGWIIFFIKNLKLANVKIKKVLRELNFQKSALDSHAIVSMTDLKGNITYVNDKFCDISEYSREELIGKNHRMLKSDEHDDVFFKDIWKTIANGKTWHGEVKNFKKDKGFYWVRASIMPILNEFHEPTQYISIRTDITKIKEIEKELIIAKKNADKANLVKSQFLANMSHEIRTPLNAIIGFSDILCSSKLNKEDREYSNIISKSANSLLDIIDDVLDLSKIESGKIEIVNESFETNMFIEHIVELFSVKAKEKKIRFVYDSDPNLPFRIISDSTRLRQVLSNLLSNAIKFTPKEGRITFCIKVLNTKNKNTQISFNVKDSGIGINEVQQKIIFEPFQQADEGITRKYGGTGLGLAISNDIVKLFGSEIKVKSEIGKGSEFMFVLDVPIDMLLNQNKKNNLRFFLCEIKEDNEHLERNLTNYLKGIGAVYTSKNNNIEPIDILFCFNNDDLPVISKFKKMNSALKIVYVGKKQDLKDNVKSIVNHFIDLPIYGSKIFNIIADNSKLYDEAVSNTTIEEKKFNIHALVAEDNLNNQKLIELLLEKVGVTCSIVNNGLEAVEFYKDHRIDLVLMDINMPVMDGVSATKVILKEQKENNLYKVPIIALTANSIVGDREKYLDAGMDDYISKPIKFEKLIEIIEKYTNIKSHKLLKEENSKNDYSILSKNTHSIKYNKTDAIKQLGLDEMTVNMLLDNFFLTLDSDLDKIQEAIESKSSEDIQHAAHYLKSSCTNFAMNEATEILEDIENRAKNGQSVDFDISKLSLIFKNIKEIVNVH